ncbi:hypothetical protein BJ546DRAFT_522440 [Cryomyces antarcticus]
MRILSHALLSSCHLATHHSRSPLGSRRAQATERGASDGPGGRVTARHGGLGHGGVSLRFAAWGEMNRREESKGEDAGELLRLERSAGQEACTLCVLRGLDVGGGGRRGLSCVRVQLEAPTRRWGYDRARCFGTWGGSWGVQSLQSLLASVGSVVCSIGRSNSSV